MVFLTYELNRLLKSHGFVRRGTAFFRVLGDGILQVVKWNRERGGAKELRIGLFSLYSELDPRWFTGSGCIPRYPVANILGQRWDCVYRYEADYRNSLIKQLDALRDAGIPWLNNIVTPEDMSRGIHYLETSWGGRYIWNDSLKMAPFLSGGDLESAQRVVRAILDQHTLGHPAESEEDLALCSLLEMIKGGNSEKIEGYLQRNYKKNLSYARFCRKAG